MDIYQCKKCKYFKEADWSRGTFSQKIFGVLGFCMDENNPYFNMYAKLFGRGISKTKAIFKPEWCRFKNNH